jgi:hypothetical protein
MGRTHEPVAKHIAEYPLRTSTPPTPAHDGRHVARDTSGRLVATYGVLEREPQYHTGPRFVLGMGCVTIVSFVLGYAWAAGWLSDPVEASPAHCLLGAGMLGVSTALGIRMWG